MRVTAVVGLLGMLALPTPAAGQPTAPCEASYALPLRDGGREVVCSKKAVRGGPPPTLDVPKKTRPQPVAVRVLTLGSLPDGGLCHRPGATRVPRAEYDAEPGFRAWEAIMLSFPRCPTAGPVPPDPEEVAIDVLERFPLPAPRPSIAPGRAITGLRAFLEPNMVQTYTGTRATELGDMAVAATATYMVDWGDERTGPHRGPGGPWPDGNISHVWTHMGTYDVVVTARWEVAWRVGGETGRLTVPTEGELVDFPVNQVQSVLHY